MYETKSINELENDFSVNKDMGLSDDEVIRRQKQFGYNEIIEHKPPSLIATFFHQLCDPMIYVLLVAVLLSILLKEYSDAIIILVVILINAIVGTIQEKKAEKALKALKQLSSPLCLVKRKGVIKEVLTKELVPGDIVVLEEGYIIPADIRFISCNNLKVEEASLTGESLPIEKNCQKSTKELPLQERHNMGFMTTSIVYGRGEGIVVNTGMNTEIGHIANILHKTKVEMTPLQKRLADLGKLLGVLTVFLCLALFLVSIIQQRNVLEMLITSISLAVAAIPEGLPAAVTIVLALGVQKMVKVNMIVRRLPSVETLGSVSVVCSDKTGTLTQNKMSVQEIFYNDEVKAVDNIKYQDIAPIIWGMTLCNNASFNNETIGDPTEIALLEMSRYFNIKIDDLKRNAPRLEELPFDSHRKMMSTMHLIKGQKIVFTKGALEMMLPHIKTIYRHGRKELLKKEDYELIQNNLKIMAQKALRVLAIAYQDNVNNIHEENMTLLGFVGMRDLPRPEVKKSVMTFKNAGIKTVMITGDHPDTAFAIAKELHIAQEQNECMLGTELDALSDDELKAKVASISVFARVTPEHKVRIVQALKASNHIVAMTGDGVNDAPSLKAADIGIAMGKGGTEVAKGAADMILADDNFSSIEKAVEEGRGIYANIKKAIIFLLSSNFGEVFTMFLGIVLRFPIPLLAIHILWVNLITDTLPALALGADPKDNDIMKEKPRHANESLFAHGGIKLTLFYGVFITLLTLSSFLAYPLSLLIKQGSFVWNQPLHNYYQIKDMFISGSPYFRLSGDDILLKSRTYAFTALGISQLFHMLGMSNIKKSFIQVFKNHNKMMLLAFFTGLILQIAVTEITFLNDFFQTSKLELWEWLWLLLMSSLPLFIHEIMYLLYYKKNPKNV